MRFAIKNKKSHATTNKKTRSSHGARNRAVPPIFSRKNLPFIKAFSQAASESNKHLPPEISPKSGDKNKEVKKQSCRSFRDTMGYLQESSPQARTNRPLS
jgi:hypothetical protein